MGDVLFDADGRPRISVGKIEFVPAGGSPCPCCSTCPDCITSDLLHEDSGWGHHADDKLLVYVPRPTFPYFIGLVNGCGGFGNCYACGASAEIGGGPIRAQYAHFGSFLVWWPAKYSLARDPFFPACNSADCGTWILCSPTAFEEAECAGGCSVGAPVAYRPGTYNPAYPCGGEDEFACCDAEAGFYPADCFTCGLTRYQKRIAQEHFPWVWEVFGFGECDPEIPSFTTGPTGEITSVQPTALWSQFLAWVHLEHHYEQECSEISEAPPATAYDLTDVLPKRYIAVCSGAPLFEFELRHAAAIGVITEDEATTAIVQLRADNDCESVIDTSRVETVREILDKIWDAGWLKCRDHRGDVALELNQLAALHPAAMTAIQSAMGRDVVYPSDLPVLGPVRKPLWDAGLDPSRVADTASDFQMPDWVLAIPEPVDDEDARRLWGNLRSTFFRASPTEGELMWDFAKWDYELPNSPENDWLGRQVSTSAPGPAWKPSGAPRDTGCIELTCDDPSEGGGCVQVPFCDGGCFGSPVADCDPEDGYYAFGGVKDVFLGTFGSYGITRFEGDCECQFFNIGTVIRASRHCDWSTAEAPWGFAPRADPWSQDWLPQEVELPSTDLGDGYPCPPCIGVNSLFDPQSTETLCPGHRCALHQPDDSACGIYPFSNPGTETSVTQGILCNPP